MAKKESSKKVKARKVAPSKKAQAACAAEEAANGTLSHQLHLHNISPQPVNWSLSGGGNRARGTTPAGSESSVRPTHAKRYKVTFWIKPAKKVAAALGPDGTAIYNGRKIYVTHPH